MGSSPSVGIVGMGSLGSAVAEMFPWALAYDQPKGIGRRDDVNGCDFVFVCVPTPVDHEGRSDLTAVEDVFGWLRPRQAILCSTVPVGTTARLRSETETPIIFQPMHGPGDTPMHPFRTLANVPWIILGGPRSECASVADLYKGVLNSSVTIQSTTSETAELSKYMENAFLAAKVAFCNEFYDLAEAVGVDFDELRELWLLDPRIGRTHTFVQRDARGFGGKCLPKDLSALLTSAHDWMGRYPTLLSAIAASNAEVRAAGRGGEDGADHANQ